MAAPAPALRIRALTLMDVLDESFRIYRANFPVLGALAILLAIPLLAVQLLSGTTTAISSYYSAVVNATGPPTSITGVNPLVGALQYPVQLVQLLQPLLTIAVTLLYFDLRVRREAFDLEVMAYQLSLPKGAAS